MRRKWQAMEISMPPPIAWPLMAAMIGLGKRSILRITLLPKRMKASTSPPENAEPRSAPPQKILSPAPVMMTERTLSSSRTAFSASFSSRMSASLMALAGGRLSVMIAYDSSRSRTSVSNPIAGDSFEEDVGHGLGGVREPVAALAEYPGGRHLVHGAEQHLGGDLHGQVAPEHAGLHALLEHGADEVEVRRNLVGGGAAEELLALAQLDLDDLGHVGVGLQRLEVQAHEPAELGRRIGLARDLLAQDADEARHLLAEEGDEDLVLRLEVEVGGAAGDPRLARDVRHARVVEAGARNADQVPRRRHAGAVAAGSGRRRVPLAARRPVRDDRDRLALVLRAPVLPAAGPRADDHAGRRGRAHAAAEVRPERLHHAVPQPGHGGARDRDDRLPLGRPHAAGLRHRRRAGARVPCRRRAVQGARAAHRRGPGHHAPLLERGRGDVRGRVLAARQDHGAAQARPAADARLDRRQQRGGHAPRGATGGRLDPLLHPARPLRRRRRPDAAVRGRSRARGAGRPFRHPRELLLRPRPRRRARDGRTVHPAQPRGRRDARAVHGPRSARAAARAPRGVRGRRWLEVHRAADVPPRADARPATSARRGRRPRLPSSVDAGVAGRGPQPRRMSPRTSGSTLPPESTTPTRAPAGSGRRRESTAAAATAPVGSVTTCARSARKRTASRTSSSLTSTTSFTFALSTGTVRAPGVVMRMPSAIVGGGGMVTRSPLRSERCVSLAVSVSTPRIWIPGKSVRATMEQPAMSPPPPTGASSASSDGTSWKSSSAAVPWPAMIA